MKLSKTPACAVCLLALCIACLVLGTGGPAFAAEGTDGWRPVYDLVMRWVNFLILAFVLVKFGKGPLVNFLKGHQAAHERDIQALEAEKGQALKQLEETLKMAADSSARFEEIRERIVEQGLRRKADIIENARQESRILILGAQRKVEGRLAGARSQFKAELVDAAVAAAARRMAGEFTEADNRDIVDRYAAGIETV